MHGIGMCGPGLRDKARTFLMNKNRAEANKDVNETKKQLEEMKAQMAHMSQLLTAQDRKRKEA